MCSLIIYSGSFETVSIPSRVTFDTPAKTPFEWHFADGVSLIGQYSVVTSLFMFTSIPDSVQIARSNSGGSKHYIDSKSDSL